MKWFQRINVIGMLCVCLIEIALCVPITFAKQTESLQKLNRSVAPFVIVSLDGLSFSDITATRMPNLFDLSQASAIGLVSINTGSDRSGIAAYASTGSGTKLSAGRLAGWNGSPSETALIPQEVDPIPLGQLYQRWTGKFADKSIVVPDVFEIQNRANASRWGSHVGFLGDQLHFKGFRTAAIGNADIADQWARFAPLFVMDHDGKVDTGDVSKQTMVADSLRPFGVRIDPNKMLSAFERSFEKSDVIFVQWGDLNRLDLMYPYLSTQAYQNTRNQVLQEADAFIGKILPQIEKRQGSLMITAVTPLHDAKTGLSRYLSPLLIMGPSVKPRTLLTSTTTHCDGVVSNFDIAPSIVHWMNAKTNQDVSMLGHQIKSGMSSYSSARMQIQNMQKLEQELTNLYRIRSSVLSVFVHLAQYILIALLTILIWRRSWLRFGKWALEMIATAPLAMLLTPVLHPSQGNTYISEILLVQLAILIILQFISREQRRCICIFFATAACIMFDLLQHSVWMKQSVLGYDLITGARYYGIGNEYMGVWLGCTLTGVFLLHVAQKAQPDGQTLQPIHKGRPIRVLELVLACSTIFFLASPKFGANAGGAIAAMVGYLMIVWKRQNVSFMRVFLSSFLVVGGLGTLLLLGFNLMASTDDATHISEAGKLLISGDITKIEDIIVRKVAMNIHLLQVSMWGTLLFVTATVLAGFWWTNRQHPVGSGKQAMQAVIGCAIAAFACNDSGVLAAAAILLYLCIGVFAREMDTVCSGNQHGFDFVKQKV